MGLENISITSVILSTVAFFVARYYINWFLAGAGIPKTMTRSMVVFIAAVAVSYSVGAVVDWIII